MPNPTAIALATNTTVQVYHQTYTVAPNPKPEDQELGPYLITSPRGKQYVLIRNSVRPHMLFAVACQPLSVPRQLWFCDRGGILVHTP